MARLPQPGSDSGTWGDILNEYLKQAHAPNGLLKDDSVTADTLAPNSVTSAAIAPNSITNAALANDAVNATTIADGSITEPLLDTALQTKINAPATIPDQSVTKSKLVTSVQTSLDKADTALQSAPVTKVAGKTGDVNLTKGDVDLANVDNTSDASKPVSSATQLALDLKIDTSTVEATYAPKENPTFTNKITSPGLVITGGVPGVGKILTSDAGGVATWQPAPTAPVTKVSGKTGDVVLTKNDVNLDNVDNTSDTTKNSATATLTNKTIDGSANTLSNIAESSVTNLVSDLASKANGAASSTANAVVRYSGTTGKTLQNSSMTIDDNGQVSATAASSTAGTYAFDFLDTNNGTNPLAFRVKQGNGARIMTIDDKGMAFSTTGTFGNTTWQSAAELEVYNELATRVIMLLKAKSSQTGDAFQYRPAGSNTPLASINAAGKVFGTGLDAMSNTITNVATPSNTTDAANKAYVDTKEASLAAGTTSQYLRGDKTWQSTLSPTSTYMDVFGYTTTPNVSTAYDAGNSTYLSNMPWSNDWYDAFAFHNKSTPAFATSTNGTAYTNGTLVNTIFAAKQATSVDRVTIPVSTWYQWTWPSGFAYATNGYGWLAISLQYTSPTPNFTVSVDSSPDGTTWTNRHSSSINATQRIMWCRVADMSSHTQLRVTIANSSTAAFPLSQLQFFTSRPDVTVDGASLPYRWDATRKIALGPGASVPTTGAVMIGTATTDNTGGLNFGGDTYLFRSGANALTVSGSVTLSGLNINGSMSMAGNMRLTPAVVSANTTMTLNSAQNQLVNAAAAAVTMTPPPTSVSGYIFTFKKTDSSTNAVTIVGTIDGLTNYTLTSQNQTVTLMSTNISGTWYTISSQGVPSGILPVANGGTGSSTQNFVDLTTAQTIAGTKTFSSTIAGAGMTIPDADSLALTTVPSGKVFDNQATNITNIMPTGQNWYDLFAYNNKSTPTVQTSTDGTTWNAATLNPYIFSAQQSSTTNRYQLVASSYVRWTWASGMTYALNNIGWLYIGLPYSQATSANLIIKVESSADGTTWTSRAITSSVQKQQTALWVRVASMSSDPQLRVTIQAATAFPAFISRLALYTNRPDMVNDGADQPIVSNGARQLGLGTSTLPSTAMVRIGDDTTTNTGGLQFGSDTFLYRVGASQLKTTAEFISAGRLQASGGLVFTPAMDTAASTGLSTSSVSYRYANAASNAMTFTLPSTTFPGVSFTFKKVDSSSNTVTINGTIDGATNYTLTSQNQVITVMSTTTAGVWYALSTNGMNLASATGILPIANGGTGSGTQNFVDLTGNQTIAGNKVFSNVVDSPKYRITAAGYPPAVLMTEVNNQLVEFGTNYNQGGARDTTIPGGYFRIDTRNTYYQQELFSVAFQDVGYPGTGTEYRPLRIGHTGNMIITGGLTMGASGNSTGSAVSVDGTQTVSNKTIIATVATLTTTVTLSTTPQRNQLCNASTAAFTVTLPSVTTPGITITLKKIDSSANAVTIAGTIDGATNYVLAAQYKYVTVISTATSGAWYITANN